MIPQIGPAASSLTGSQNFLLLEKVSQSLAGRTAILHLLPLSLAELKGRKPLPLHGLGKVQPKAPAAPASGLFETLYTGFYPRIHDKKLPARNWLDAPAVLIYGGDHAVKRSGVCVYPWFSL